MGNENDNVISFINATAPALQQINNTDFAVDMCSSILNDVLAQLPGLFEESMKKQHATQTNTPVVKEAEKHW